MTSSTDFAIGFGMCFISAIFFGSMFVPIKRFELKDGIFVQFIQCSTIMFCGIVVYCIQLFPKLYFLAVIAGALNACGNLLIVPIINRVGAGLGVLIWGSVQIFVGWATGRFGLLGLDAEVPQNDTIAYVGVFLTIVSAFGFVMVKANDQSEGRRRQPTEKNITNPTMTKVELDVMNVDCALTTATTVVKPPSTQNSSISVKLVPIFLSILTGVLFGTMLTPLTYLQTQYEHTSQNGLDYVMAYCCGLYAVSTVAFVVYLVVKRKEVYMTRELILPSAAYGLMWAIATFAWIVGSQKLSQSISFPINTRLPGIITSLWGVFYFREMTGTQNLIILTCSIIVAVVGVTCVGLANVI